MTLDPQLAAAEATRLDRDRTRVCFQTEDLSIKIKKLSFNLYR